MNGLSGLSLVLVLAVTVEALTEYVKLLINAISHRCFRTIAICGLSVAMSVAVCVLAGADLFAVIGVRFVGKRVGSVLTGIFVSRGANYLNDFVSRLTGRAAQIPRDAADGENPAAKPAAQNRPEPPADGSQDGDC